METKWASNDNMKISMKNILGSMRESDHTSFNRIGVYPAEFFAVSTEQFFLRVDLL